MKVVPYISFNGNCEKAVEFYHSILGGNISVMYFKEIPEEEGILISEDWKDKVMHSSLTFDDGNTIFFGDTWEGTPLKIGNNAAIHLVTENEQDVYDYVEKLSADGEITMPVEKTFWNSVYGSVVDQFGICWGIEFEIK